MNDKLIDINANVQIAIKHNYGVYVQFQLRTDTILYAWKKAKEKQKLEGALKKKLQCFKVSAQKTLLRWNIKNISEQRLTEKVISQGKIMDFY